MISKRGPWEGGGGGSAAAGRREAVRSGAVVTRWHRAASLAFEGRLGVVRAGHEDVLPAKSRVKRGAEYGHNRVAAIADGDAARAGACFNMCNTQR